MKKQVLREVLKKQAEELKPKKKETKKSDK